MIINFDKKLLFSMKQTKFKIKSDTMDISFVINGKPRLDHLKDIMIRYALMIGYTPLQIEQEFGKLDFKYQKDYNQLMLFD